MHGKYLIKVVQGSEVLFEYSAPCHPVGGQLIKMGEYEHLVSGISHVLKLAQNGGTSFKALDYVEVKVY